MAVRGAKWTLVSGSSAVAVDARDLPTQPGPRDLPLPLDRALRDTDGRSGLSHREPAEEPELDDLPLPGVERAQARERLVEDDEIESFGSGRLRKGVEIVHGHQRGA